MSNIITISREFGSGGRELAKRLAESLGYAYYDKEIIEEIAKQGNLDKEFIQNITENKNSNYNYTIGRSLNLYSVRQKQEMDILILQQKVIKELAKEGNCVIVGCGADLILKEYKPLNIFVYASSASKIKRCREKSSENIDINDKKLLKMIKNVDKSRARFYLLIGGDYWGYKENYTLCINTSEVQIKNIIPSVSSFARNYLGGND